DRRALSIIIEQRDFLRRKDSIPKANVVDFAIPLTIARVRVVRWIFADRQVITARLEDGFSGIDTMDDAIEVEGSSELGPCSIGDSDEVMPLAVVHRRHVIGTFAHSTGVRNTSAGIPAAGDAVARVFALGDQGLPGFVEAFHFEPPGDGEAAVSK